MKVNKTNGRPRCVKIRSVFVSQSLKGSILILFFPLFCVSFLRVQVTGGCLLLRKLECSMKRSFLCH